MQTLFCPVLSKHKQISCLSLLSCLPCVPWGLCVAPPSLLPLLLRDGLLLPYAVSAPAFLAVCLASFSILDKTSAEDLQLKAFSLALKGYLACFKAFPRIVRSLVRKFYSFTSCSFSSAEAPALGGSCDIFVSHRRAQSSQQCSAAELSEVFLIPCLAVPAVPGPDGDPVSAQCCSPSSPAPP